mgnify:CR=1 FL=1
MERDIEFLLNKYYNDNGQEKFVYGERWSNEHMSNHISEQRLQEKMVDVTKLGFRLSREEKDRIEYIIRLLDKDFNKINRSLFSDQILVMIVCFIRMEKDPNHRGTYYKKLYEWDITDKQYNMFLISLLKEYRS